MIQKKVLITLLTIAVLPMGLRGATVYADEITISNNGSGSSSDATVSQSTQTSVTQNNTGTITNTVDVNANTGGNTASNNSGGSTSTTTGGVDASTTVNNTLNSSDVTSNACCQTPSNGQAVITGNGSDSHNAVAYSNTTNTTVTSTNNASITTVINGSANTGGNHSSYNSGNTSIHTGAITVVENVKNIANNAAVTVSSQTQGDFLIKISGNGAGSTNLISLSQDHNSLITVNNTADILNLNFWNLVTGNNTADYNNGDTTITTGDITVAIGITNDVNHSTATVECGCQPTPPPPPPCQGDSCTPSTTTNGGGGSGGGSSSGGGGSSSPSVLGATTGEVLPATGNPWIFLAILGNLLLLFFGAALRLKSGRSPSLALSLSL